MKHINMTPDIINMTPDTRGGMHCTHSEAQVVATGKLTAQAEATKCAAVIASDKIKSAYDRMAKIDIEKMTRYADAAERLVAALTHLEQLDRNGKLKALFDTLKDAK
jgi:hypothetical protein